MIFEGNCVPAKAYLEGTNLFLDRYFDITTSINWTKSNESISVIYFVLILLLIHPDRRLSASMLRTIPLMNIGR